MPGSSPCACNKQNRYENTLQYWSYRQCDAGGTVKQAATATCLPQSVRGGAEKSQTMAEVKAARLSGYYGELKKFIENSNYNKVIKVANKSKCASESRQTEVFHLAFAVHRQTR